MGLDRKSIEIKVTYHRELLANDIAELSLVRKIGFGTKFSTQTHSHTKMDFVWKSD